MRQLLKPREQTMLRLRGKKRMLLPQYTKLLEPKVHKGCMEWCACIPDNVSYTRQAKVLVLNASIVKEHEGSSRA